MLLCNCKAAKSVSTAGRKPTLRRPVQFLSYDILTRRHFAGDWEAHVEGSSGGSGLVIDPGMVPGGDAVTDGQAQPGPVVFGGDKWGAQFTSDRRG